MRRVTGVALGVAMASVSACATILGYDGITDVAPDASPGQGDAHDTSPPDSGPADSGPTGVTNDGGDAATDAADAATDAATTVRQISAGVNFACALLTNGTVKCWGADKYGQLGVPSGNLGTCPESATFPCSPTPTEVPLPATMIGVTAAFGGEFACAFGGTGVGVYCWGSNDQELGNDSSDGGPAPVLVEGTGATLVGVNQLAASAEGDLTSGHACAISGGDVYCWGRNESHQSSVAPDAGASLPNARLFPMSAPAVGVAAGFDVSCAATRKAVECWGGDAVGQCGTQNAGACATGYTFNPVPNNGLLQSVVAGAYHACVLALTNNVFCWGQDVTGETALDPLDENAYACAADASYTCVPPTEISFPLGVMPTLITTGYFDTFALGTDGHVYSWGGAVQGNLGYPFLGDGGTCPIPPHLGVCNLTPTAIPNLP